MDFNEVAIFIKVVQKGSFTGAAMALDMPKSTVSMKITNLEKRLGVTLLTRSTRKLRVTPAGEAFFLRSTKGIEEILAAEVAVRSENVEPHGRFRITAPVDAGNNILPELTAVFLKKFPRVQIEILLTDRRVDFLEDEIDLAIRAGELKDSSLIAKRVGEVGFGLYASPKYLKERGVPATPKDLNSHSCISFTPHSPNGWILLNAKRSVTVDVPGKILVNDMGFAYSLAMQGTGIAFLPTFSCEADVKSGKLISVLSEWKSKIEPVHLVYPAQKYVPLATKAFIEMATVPIQKRFKL